MLLTVKQAAEFLNVSESAVYKWAESGVLTGRKLNGKLWRFSREDLDGFGKSSNVVKIKSPGVTNNDCQVQKGQRKLVLSV